MTYLADAYEKGWRFIPLGVGVFVELSRRWRIGNKKRLMAFDYIFDEVLPSIGPYEIHEIPPFPHSINLLSRRTKKRKSLGDNLGAYTFGFRI